ncbi:MAG: hypothetical protein SGPRY_008344, partial [Prymnesium sp.]
EFSLSSKPESLASRSPDMTSASLPSTTTSSFGLGGNGLSHSGSLSSLHKSRELCRSVSECLNPDMKSSHFLDERERTSPSLKWSMSVGSLQETVEKRESRERKESRLQWLTSTRDAREARHAANVAQLKEKREGSLKLKYGAMQDHLERMTDIQLMRLSQDFDRGRRAVLLEPPVRDGWGHSRPHNSSHWKTIGRVHADPPRNDKEQIVAYRRGAPNDLHIP